MNWKKNTGFTFLRSLVLWLTGVSLLIFVITASLLSLFGNSLWSWMNVLRFIIGGAIVFTLCCYFLLVRAMLAKQKK